MPAGALPLQRRWRSPTRRRASLRHDQAFLAAVLVAADHDAAAVRLRAVEQARQRAVGGARPEPHGGVARASSRRCSRPATSCRRRPVASYDDGRRAAASAARRGVRRRAGATSAATSSAARPQVQVLLDGTDPITAARVGGYISAGRRGVRRRARRAARRARRPAPRRSAPALLLQPDAARSRVLPRGAGRHAAHQPLPLGDEPRASSASARAARTSTCSSQPTTPLEIVLGKLAAATSSSATRCCCSRCCSPGSCSASGRAAAGWRCSS